MAVIRGLVLLFLVFSLEYAAAQNNLCPRRLTPHGRPTVRVFTTPAVICAILKGSLYKLKDKYHIFCMWIRCAFNVEDDKFWQKSLQNETCSVGWQRFGAKCFRFFPQTVNWATAEKICQVFGGNLASVRTKVKNDFLLSLVPRNTRAWIGGHDGLVDGQWLWRNGARFDYTNWCRGEPNNHRRPENCLELNFSRNRCWNDVSCSAAMGYICGRKPS